MNTEKSLVSALVILLGFIAIVLAYNALTDETIFANMYATLSVAALVGALVVLRVYEVWRK